ncbi:conserved protein of unknown function [Rhodovastum atsumiense]|uniref:Uncharacterized protein n=1 Tax=Rhodovastum atsumiense TaxID=504468 RepID=A0A5M6IY70_9PROT|nr:hypothetical protein [Rhodovastum atsumiense]KAA5613290.1 hypothetical protein F1189_06260 [Rhodovastum atsumiense]CAH2600544.1 conserved protein of unknown function [Rhodovastum atsumiense]
MSYEFLTSGGAVRLVSVERHWLLEFSGRRRGAWRTADDAAAAVAHHKSGLRQWDRQSDEVSEDLLDWRPLAESL